MNALDEVIDDKIIIEYTSIDRVMMFVQPLFAAMCAKDGNNCLKTIILPDQKVNNITIRSATPHKISGGTAFYFNLRV